MANGACGLRKTEDLIVKQFFMKSMVVIIFLSHAYAYSSSQSSYSFKVYLKDQVIEVFRDGILLKKMPCSTGIKPGSTPPGKFKTSQREEKVSWVEKDGTEIKFYYVTRFNAHISFHSMLEGKHPFVDEGKKLFSERKPSSMGCVRLKKEDAKWVYSLPLGATVEVMVSGTP